MIPRLPELVEALLDPKAYPETPEQIELVQTQMSFMFLTGDYVYKMKKPVNLGYLDYTSLDKRHFYCPQEVAVARILRRTKGDYESNGLTEQAYLNNKKKFEAVDLDDLKELYPELGITHLVVDTRYDQPEDWHIIGMEKK